MATHRRHTARAAEIKLQQLLTAGCFDDAGWKEMIAPDVHLRIGNNAPAIGKDASLAALSVFFGRIDSVGNGYWELCRRRETIFAEVEIRFLDTGGADRRIPCVIVARLASGSLLDLRLAFDPSPIPPGA
jgi:hypothetical protein